MKQYLDLMQRIMDEGVDRKTRTGIDERSLFGAQVRYDLTKNFPLLTTKKVFLKGIIYELLWFLRGDTNIKFLVDHDVKIWNEWAYQVWLEESGLAGKIERYSDEWKDKLEEFVQNIKKSEKFAEKWGDLGPVYGKQWTRWEAKDGREINQIQEAVNTIKNDPDSRRIIVSGWNIGDIVGLVKNAHHAPPTCHTLFQFYVHDGTLSCQLYQRSADYFLGVPFNIASYALLTMMMAQVTGLKPKEFVHTFGDVHIYHNHFDQVKEQLSRKPKKLPTMKLNPKVKDIFSFEYEDFTLENYDPDPAIFAPIAV